MTNDNYTFGNDAITAVVKADGAELCSLRNAEGVDLLWQAGPQWPRHAPTLFPIVGRLKNDVLRHHGKLYPMTQHGFARDHRFEWVERGPASCTLVLSDNVQTRARYPFGFRLAISFAVTGPGLDVALEVANTGDEMLPASIGAHPAFNWPLLPGLSKEAYELTFSRNEPASIRRLRDGLLRAAPEPTPITGNKLALREKLFEDDAVILDQVASTSVCYAADRGPAIEVSWEGFRELGVWSKLGGAPFLCIEPWHGFASPSDFDGEFADKPGVMHIADGEKRILKYRIGVGLRSNRISNPD
jgi:galactose mutarotase-like enzyme